MVNGDALQITELRAGESSTACACEPHLDASDAAHQSTQNLNALHSGQILRSTFPSPFPRFYDIYAAIILLMRYCPAAWKALDV